VITAGLPPVILEEAVVAGQVDQRQHMQSSESRWSRALTGRRPSRIAPAGTTAAAGLDLRDLAHDHDGGFLFKVSRGDGRP
jgi:hypothetical protein